MTNTAEQIKKTLRKKTPKPTISHEDFLSTGLTTLNLACSGLREGGLVKGHIYLMVGDSRAGKSWLSMQCLAEAANNPSFKNHRLIHDDPERGVLMDKRRYFGDRLADKLEPPSPKGSSKTLEQFYDNVATAAENGVPFIYVLDSEDALQSEDDMKKAKANRKARTNDDSDGQKGSYGTAKAKLNSSRLREAHNLLEATKSILIIIKQSRQNIGFGAQLNPKTRNGGVALTFYATLELWFSVREKIKKKVNGKQRTIGSMLRVEIKKNRVAGRERSVLLPFYPAVGFDDLGACVHFLVDEKHWKDSKGVITADELELKLRQEELIAKIEEEGLEDDLRRVVSKIWREIEDQCSVTRKPRYV